MQPSERVSLNYSVECHTTTSSCPSPGSSCTPAQASRVWGPDQGWGPALGPRLKLRKTSDKVATALLSLAYSSLSLRSEDYGAWTKMVRFNSRPVDSSVLDV